MNSSLRRIGGRLGLSLILCSLIAVVIWLAQVNTAQFRQHMITQMQHQLLVQAEAEASHIEKTLMDVQQSLLLLANNPEIQHRCSTSWADLYSPVPDDRLETMMYRRLEQDLVSLSCLDRTGKVLSYIPWVPGRVGSDYSMREDVKRVLANHQSYLRSIFRNDVGEYCLAYSCPVFHQKRLVGVLRATIPTRIIHDCLNESQVRDRRRIWMIDEQGIFISHPNSSWVGQPLVPHERRDDFDRGCGDEILNRLWSGQADADIATLVCFDEPEQILAWQPMMVAGKVWTVCASIPLHEVMAPVGRHIRNVSLMAVALVLLITCMGIWLTRIQHEKESLLERAALVDQLQQARDEILMSMGETVESKRQLQEKHAFINNILESLPYPLYVIDARNYQVKLMNATAREKLNVPHQEVLTCYAMTHHRQMPCEGNDDPCPLEEIRRTLRPVVVEHIHYDMSDIPQHVEIHAYPLFNEAGELEDVIEYTIDITERRHAERKVIEQKNMLEAMLGAMDCSVTIRDCDYRLTYQNAKSLELYGDRTGQTCYTALAQCQDVCQGCPVALSFEDGQGHVFVKEGQTVDGRTLVLENTANPIRDDQGEIVACLEISRDITARVKIDQERQELHNQLRQKQKLEAIGTLAGGIAHDFNNILMAIEGYTELAQSELDSESRPHQDMQQVLTAGKRGQQLVKQILAFSRKTDMATRPVQAAPVLQEALDMLRPSIPKTLELIEDIDPEPHWIRANDTHLHQLLVNLCTNAVHAIGQKPGQIQVTLRTVTLSDELEVEIKCLAPGDYLQLEVKDNGCGMSPDILTRIYDPFFTTKEVDKGTGLGMAVVHGIVECCQGGIQIESVVGKGTCVRLWFPIVAEGEESVLDTFNLTMGEGQRILLVDDESDIVNIMKRQLTHWGYETIGTTNAQAALDFLDHAKKPFDLVITDYAMPKINGVDLAGMIRERFVGLPVLLCTGCDDNLDAEQCRAVGIVEVLTKPIDSKSLVAMINNILQVSENAK